MSADFLVLNGELGVLAYSYRLEKSSNEHTEIIVVIPHLEIVILIREALSTLNIVLKILA